MSIRCVFILLLLQTCVITLCNVLPPPIPQQNHQSPGLLALNGSTSDNSFNPFSLSQRMDRLLQLQSLSRDPKFRRASLTGVFLSQMSGAQTVTSDPRHLQNLVASFRVHGEPPRPGFRETLIFSDPTGGDWYYDQRILRTEEIWEKEHEIQWREVERLMSLEEADSRIKAAGFMSPLRQVEIQQFDESPLAYCFKFIYGNVGAACVGILDKRVWATR